MTARPTPKEVLTLAEAAVYLRMSTRRAQELAAAGVLPHFTYVADGHRYVRLEDLRAFIDARVKATMASLPIDPATDTPVDLRRTA